MSFERCCIFFFFQAEDGIRDLTVTGVQTCALPILHSHLVTVKVGIEGRTDQRMQLDSAAFYQHSLKSLDTQAVQRWRTVQEHRVILNDLFQYIPHFRLHALHKTLGAFDIVRKVLLNQLAHDEWLEEFKRHSLRETTLVQLQVRTYHNNRAARVVYTLTEQVLAEAPLLTFEHIGQALELVVP